MKYKPSQEMIGILYRFNIDSSCSFILTAWVSAEKEKHKSIDWWKNKTKNEWKRENEWKSENELTAVISFSTIIVYFDSFSVHIIQP